MISRRSLFCGLIAAPVIVRAGSLMSIRGEILMPSIGDVTKLTMDQILGYIREYEQALIDYPEVYLP